MPSSQLTFLNIPQQPKRLRIGEAARLLGLEPYVLRFWESEFPQLAPMRTEKGQRLYSREDLELVRKIQKLLHEEGLTIEGARRRLEYGAEFLELTSTIAQELRAIRQILANSP
jgi:DNA-binding transcriptional MerR regulator